jgi:5-(carboxyamino)imidazole ribonucleotide synthase
VHLLAERRPIFLPGSTVGVLGSGQLGRMFAIAARQMGYRVHTLSPDSDTPTGQVADREFTCPYDDLESVAEFARGVNVVTFEFENVPAATANVVSHYAEVRPAGSVLHVTQNRMREKTFLAQNGFPVTPFRAVKSAAEALAVVKMLGLPGVLKTAAFGYDGKGQATVRDVAEITKAVEPDPAVERVYEAFVDFEREVSVVAARGQDGAFAHWGVIDNTHRNHILDLSVCPAEVPARVLADAVEIARGILEQLEVVGVLCVEFFLTKAGKLLVNELAPRPHNSGHLTIDAHVTSQFEQQLRAVCGLPLGSTRQLRPAAMANLLGDLWEPGEPNWAAACAAPEVNLHLYGKLEPRAGRKMGHVTALADTQRQAAANVFAARRSLTLPR